MTSNDDDDDSLRELLQLSPNLEELSLHNVDMGEEPQLLNFSDESLARESSDDHHDSFPELKCITVSARRSESLKALLEIMTTFSSLQHVRVSSITWVDEPNADENFEADVAVLSVFEKSWLSLSTLIGLDMVHGPCAL
ncbi:hypothetical protein BG000_006001 [Podila horticola]|nr:hypothetical protein BG000_006001 [Podila horticola]